MKKVILSSIVFAVSLMAHAQSTNPEVEQKIAQMGNAVDSLKSTVTAMQTAMANMQVKVDEVTKQNLALKQAISLQPTIAEATSNRNINYRLIEAKGNRTTGEITFVVSVLSTGRIEQSITLEPPVFIDEQGETHRDTKYASTLGDNSLAVATTLFPDTPVKLILKTQADNEPQFIKTLDLRPGQNLNIDGFRFTNIPIKWE